MAKIDAATRSKIEKVLGDIPAEDRKVLESFMKGNKARRTDAATLQGKYPHMVEGSLGFDSVANKQFVMITCTHPGCEKQRRVYTSDLHQVSMCEDHKAEQVKARKATRDAKVAEILKREGITA